MFVVQKVIDTHSTTEGLSALHLILSTLKSFSFNFYLFYFLFQVIGFLAALVHILDGILALRDFRRVRIVQR